MEAEQKKRKVRRDIEDTMYNGVHGGASKFTGHPLFSDFNLMRVASPTDEEFAVKARVEAIAKLVIGEVDFCIGEAYIVDHGEQLNLKMNVSFRQKTHDMYHYCPCSPRVTIGGKPLTLDVTFYGGNMEDTTRPNDLCDKLEKAIETEELVYALWTRLESKGA